MIESVMRIVSDLISAGLGYLISAKIPVPRRTAYWVVFALVIILVRDTARSRHLIAVYEFWLDPSLQGVCIGILFGFIIRGKIRQQKDESGR